MERLIISEKLTDVFKKVFNNDTFILTEDLTANDVDNWDSLTHMVLISEIEDAFQVKFRLKELNKVQKVGDLADLLILKL